MPIIFILLWSSGYIFIKTGLQDCPPVTFVAWRMFFAFIIILGLFFYQRQTLPKSWTQIARISLTGILLAGLYQVFFFASLYYHVPGGVLAIILGSQPLVTMLIFRESVSIQQLLGLLLGFAGLALVVSNNLWSGMITFSGIGCAALSLSCITYGTILQKKYCSEIPLTTNLLVQYFACLCVLVPLVLYLDAPSVIWSLRFAVALAWVVVVISIGATFLFYTLLKRGQATKVTSLLYAMPVLTAIMDYVFFQQMLSTVSILGISLVLFGLLLIHNAGWLPSRLLFTRFSALRSD